MKLPKITVIIPCLPDKTPKESLETLKKTDYQKGKIEILVTQGKNPSRQRNLAIDKASGEIIFFFDEDATIPKDHIRRTLAHYEKQIDALGGPVETSKTDSFLQRCFGYVIGSYFATQSMSNKFKGRGIARKATEKELILCNFSIRKSSLGEHRFDERLYPNEENELFNRLMSEGKVLFYDPELKVYRKQRENLLLFAKQFYKYGYSRIEHLLIRPSSFSLVFLVPPVFTIYIVALVTSVFFLRPSFLYLSPLLLYALIANISAINIAITEKNLKSTLVTPFLFLVVHMSYGIGMIIRLLKFGKEERPKEVKITKIKLK